MVIFFRSFIAIVSDVISPGQGFDKCDLWFRSTGVCNVRTFLLTC